MVSIIDQLKEKVNETFLRECNRLKERYSELYERMLAFNMPFINTDSLSMKRFNCEFYEHNGLYIDKKFIEDNTDIIFSADELCDWLEGVVNLALKESGIKYNKEKVSYLERLTDTEEEAEPELER